MNSKVEHDSWEGRVYKSCGCIKCGLDDSVLDKKREWLSFHQKIMYDYLKESAIRNEKRTAYSYYGASISYKGFLKRINKIAVV